MDIIDRPTKLPSCPYWCEVDHEEQQRELDLANFPADREPHHDRTLATGIETESHGPLYRVTLERSGGCTRLYVALEAFTITADQAEVLGLALVRAAHMLRTCPDAVETTQLTTYLAGADSYVQRGPLLLEPTAAEHALHAVESASRADGIAGAK